MAQLIKLLKEVSEAHGAPGHEDELRNIFIRELSKLGDLVEDRLGGCAIRLKNSSPKAKKKIFLGAHFDEVGFIVQNIRPDGWIQIHELGAWWGHTVMSQRLRIRSRKTGKDILGVVCSIPPHLLANKDKVINIQDMFVDIGANSRAEAEKMGVQVGDPIVPDSAFTDLGKGLYMGKAFDNRAGVTVAIEAAKELAKGKLNAEVYVGCTVQEEMGLRGAHTLAHLLDVDEAILLEGAPADDTPGLSPLDAQTKMGKGVQVRIMDRSAIMSRKLVDQVLAVAEKKKIPTQVAVRRTGGTDAGGFSLTRHGSRCCVLSTPCRYIHTHNALLNEKDLEACLKLSVETIRELAK